MGFMKRQDIKKWVVLKKCYNSIIYEEEKAFFKFKKVV